MDALTAMKQALDAMTLVASIYTDRHDPSLETPITNLRTAIEEMEKVEPVINGSTKYYKFDLVGHVVKWVDGSLIHAWLGDPPDEGAELYIRRNK